MLRRDPIDELAKKQDMIREVARADDRPPFLEGLDRQRGVVTQTSAHVLILEASDRVVACHSSIVDLSILINQQEAHGRSRVVRPRCSVCRTRALTPSRTPAELLGHGSAARVGCISLKSRMHYP